MILAAGLGTRLRPLTLTTPKPLVEVGGEPLIYRTLRMVKRAGVEEVVINLHHLGDRIKENLGDGGKFGLRISYSEEAEILGSGGGIKKAEALLGDSTFLVINGDALLDLDLAAVLRFHREKGALGTMVLRPDPDPDSWGAIEIDGEQRIRQFVGKLPPVAVPLRKLMFTGVHVLEPAVFGYLEPTFSSINEVFYPRAIAEGKPIFGYVYEGYWSDVGTPESLETVRRDAALGVI
jgi:NDP-sugar pyrophosphorylase family protein